MNGESWENSLTLLHIPSRQPCVSDTHNARYLSRPGDYSPGFVAPRFSDKIPRLMSAKD
jgi:hypothetical protein